MDHRSIESVVFQNVKYVLKKGAKNPEEEAKKNRDEPKWDTAKLAVGNWFSGTSYFEAVEDRGEQVLCKSKDKMIEISKDILEYEMHNASVFAEEEKMSLTQVATKLTEANSKCFQVCFTTKVDDKLVLEKLNELKGKPKAAEVKALAKELLMGKETTITGRLSRAEGKMGRSLVIDLPTQGYRQVDHRTIRWLTIDNVK